MLQTQKIKKEVFFTFDGKHGIVIRQLTEAQYLIVQGDLYYAFTFKQLKVSPRNDKFVTLPFITGVTEFPSRYAMKLKTFNTFIKAFENAFDIPLPLESSN